MLGSYEHDTVLDNKAHVITCSLTQLSSSFCISPGPTDGALHTADFDRAKIDSC